MIKVGLTGTIGSGKSQVAQILKQQGIPVLDLDVVAAQVREASSKQIIACFGEQITVDGVIDRNKLAKLIFTDEYKRKQLEAIIHPQVLQNMQRFFQEHQKQALVVVEQALLFELGWEKYYDEVWLVDASHEVAMERLIKYRGYEKELAISILDKQQSNEQKKDKVKYCIENNGTIDILKKQVMEIIRGIHVETKG